MSLSTVSKEVRKAWSASVPLTAAGIVLLVAFVPSAAGIFLDHRVITGVPAWLKPAKFAISTAIFCGTLAWLYRYISVWPRFVRAMGWAVSVISILEVAIIDVQAARGTTSHFNLSTPLDAVLFGIMGAAIGVLWLASVGILAALFKQKFSSPAWGWWLRMGTLTTVLGAAAGGMMLRPTPEQGVALHTTDSVHTVGGHTVGGPDGGAGIAGVGWSTEHGDLRIPHFFGLHGLQIIPLFGWLLLGGRRARRQRRQASIAVAATASYLGFVGILTWQALRGQSIVAPDTATLYAIAVWLAVTAVAGFTLLRSAIPSESYSATSRTAL